MFGFARLAFDLVLFPGPGHQDKQFLSDLVGRDLVAAVLGPSVSSKQGPGFLADPIPQERGVYSQTGASPFAWARRLSSFSFRRIRVFGDGRL